MKKMVMMVAAAILGSVITLGISKFFAPQQVAPQTDTAAPVQMVSNNPDAAKTNLISFRAASQKSVETVVHIRSTSVVKRNRYNSYYDFFGRKHAQPHQHKQQSTGSGVIVSTDGYIVTNNHVINGAQEVDITLHDNRTYRAEVVGNDPSTDIAVVKIAEEDLPFIYFANSDEVLVGDWVLAVGNPFNLASTVTAGIVSAKARNIDILKDKSAIESFIQTDAAVNPGNSGGALVNTNGDLIGINTAIATPTGTYAGYSFAVPSNIVNKVVNDLITYGIVQRAFLGAQIRDMNSTLADELSINTTEGIYIEAVAHGSAAHSAGLESGDIVTAIDNTEVSRTPELLEQIGRRSPGEKVELTLIRAGNSKKISVTLQNKNGNIGVVEKENFDLSNYLGVNLRELTNAEQKKLGLSGGVLITELDANGKLRKETAMKNNFIILKINSMPVRSKEDLIGGLQKSKNSVVIEGVYPHFYGRYYYAFGL